MNRVCCLVSPLVFYVTAATGAGLGLSGDVGPERGAASENNVAPISNAQPSPERSPMAPGLVNTGVGEDSGLLPLPPGQPTYHHYYNMASGLVTDVPPTESSVAGAMKPIKVYSNTPPPMFTFRTSGFELGDDIHSVAVGGCDVSMYAIQMARSVMGCSNNGRPCENDNDCFGAPTCIVRPDPGFSTTVALYDACPDDGGQLIPGTQATIAVPTNGIHTINIDLSGAPVNVDSSFWIILTTDKPNAGVIVGRPATLGFTDNKHHLAPLLPCEARFSGTPIYAGYHVEVYCVGDFDREFIAYHNIIVSFSLDDFTPGADTWVADDIDPIVDDCLLSGYEITSESFYPFTLEAEIRASCNQATKIAGTERTFNGIGSGDPEIARFDFPIQPPGMINLPSTFWVAWRYDTDNASTLVAEEPEIGRSDDIFGLPDMGCNFFFGGDPQASFAISVRCFGELPVGACCDLTPSPDGSGDIFCTENSELACTGLENSSPRRWSEGATCEGPLAVDPPCAALACCVADPQPRGSCLDVPPDECDSLGGIAGGPRICEPDASLCGWFPCLQAGTDCCLTGNINSCADNACCNRVCDLDSWCCEVTWDESCAEEAREFCEPSCPSESVNWIDPPRWVTDARQPHPPTDSSQSQGLRTFLVDPPDNATVCCWSACDSNGPVSIEEFINLPDGTLQLVTAEPLLGGIIIEFTYEGSFPSANFTSHPGDVNGEGLSSLNDVVHLSNFLQGNVGVAWDLFGCDIDRSGECDPADLLRLIDLLHGGGTYEVWNGTVRSNQSFQCP